VWNVCVCVCVSLCARSVSSVKKCWMWSVRESTESIKFVREACVRRVIA
jgi:hypothetical protein